MASPAAPAVSVIVNCRNGGRYLAAALDSVFAQTWQDWELIFWDNCSRDDSAAIARGYGERVRYFLSPAPASLGAARAGAVAQARGSWLALLDSDDVWLPEHLATLLPLLEPHPGCALAWGDAQRIGPGGEPLGRFSDRFEFRRGHCFPKLFHDGHLGPSSSMLMRREAVEAVGGYRHDLSICSDLDLFYRLAARWEVDFAPAATALYRHHGGNDSRNGDLLVAEEVKLLDYWLEHGAAAGLHGSDLAFQKMRLGLKASLQSAQARHYGRSAVWLLGALAAGLRHPREWAEAYRYFVNWRQPAGAARAAVP